MNRLLSLFCCSLLALSSWHCQSDQNTTAEAPTSRPDQPNIIYILADDLGYGDLSCYGQTRFTTPNLDQLAKEGLKFNRHYAGSTVCAPSRSSLMTGMHTGNTFIRGNKAVKPEGQWPLADSMLTVAELLQDAGYTTAALGKWGLGPPGSEGEPNAQGFDFFYGYNCQREAHNYYPDHLWKNTERVELPKNANGGREIYAHDLIVDETLDFIEGHQAEPFFLFLPYTIPHASLEGPAADLAPFEGKYEETAYEGNHYYSQPQPHATFAAMVSRLDRDVGKILKLLDRLNLADNTLVIFTSDNGPHQEGGADPAFFNSGGGLRGIKRDLYEGGVRVPMIARWPGVIPPHQETDHISSFWDFLPTACDIAKVESPEFVDGISFLPLLTGQQQPEHGYLYWEFHEQGGKQAVLMEPWKGVRLDMANNPQAPIELYNLQDDPGETKDIAAAHPEVVAQLAEIMDISHVRSPDFSFPWEQEGE